MQSPAAFFASRLFNAVKGMGTDDNTLIRVIVSRSEIDLGEIKQEFERMYDRTLLSAVKVSFDSSFRFEEKLLTWTELCPIKTPFDSIFFSE